MRRGEVGLSEGKGITLEGVLGLPEKFNNWQFVTNKN